MRSATIWALKAKDSGQIGGTQHVQEDNMSQSLQFERTIAAPVAEVYRAFTSATALREWFCDAAMADPKPGGRFYAWWNNGYYSSGEFKRLEPRESILFTWLGRGEPAATQVQVSFRPVGDETVVAVDHSGFSDGQEWAGTAQALQAGWENSLENLQSVLATGQDLRFVRRPMLGVFIGDFDEKIAVELGVPVKEGVRLDDTVEGMGARAAGLQKDDVVVSLAGQTITDWPSLTASLQRVHAGDEVEVTYYRGGQQKSATMTLSGRPLPAIPATAAELSQAVAALYAASGAALAQALAGVAEAEASHRPADGEWSAQETLAHLIVSERETHAWITELINDGERWSDNWANLAVVPARLQSIVSAYSTTADLLQEVQRGQATTIAMLANLPLAFVARKGSYWRLAYNLLDGQSHAQVHLEQIQAALPNR
jgi:uncharacterized protein YndB with AHSA1/START domain